MPAYVYILTNRHRTVLYTGVTVALGTRTVSYTHLRAHETP